jgi:hypothetical protein
MIGKVCNSQQELRNKRHLENNEVFMRVGNGHKVDVKAVGDLHLTLPFRINRFEYEHH